MSGNDLSDKRKQRTKGFQSETQLEPNKIGLWIFRKISTIGAISYFRSQAGAEGQTGAGLKNMLMKPLDFQTFFLTLAATEP